MNSIEELYELLKTSPNKALKLLEKHRLQDPGYFLEEHKLKQYKKLTVIPLDNKTEIFLGDRQCNLVQKETGTMVASVLPGIYYVHFGMYGERHLVKLHENFELKEPPSMIDVLNSMLKNEIPNLLKQEDVWDSLIVNRRKPHTYRVFTKVNDLRVCLHKFDTCSSEEAFVHPHPWKGAFILLQGSYRMKLGQAPNRQRVPLAWTEHILTAGSMYEISSPLTFHNVQPLETCYTIMVNGEPFSPKIAHVKTVTTKGKDLDKMPADKLKQHLAYFCKLLGV